MNRSKYDEVFRKVYGNDDIVLDRQFTRFEKLTNTFHSIFGEGDLKYFSTPGRTEIGGNHTDHNHGRVLAGSVNLDSVAAVMKSDDAKVILYSEGFDGAFEVDLEDLSVKSGENETTNSLIRGIAARFKELGYKIGGFKGCMTSDVLAGSGLSSSASVEVMIGSIFNSLFNEGRVSAEELAIIGQYAENNYFGKPCGLMDQVACAMGGIVTIDFEDPSAPLIKKVDFDFSAQEFNLLVVNTGGSHADLTADYAAVPSEMKAVAAALNGKVLRDITIEELVPEIPKLRKLTGDRAILRALHFLIENERVVKQVEALENNNFIAFLGLIKDSGNSSFKWLQNVYTTKKVDEQGVSLALALSEKYIVDIGEGACRVHGGGFAGTIQVFLPVSKVDAYTKMMESVYGKGSVYVLKIRALGAVCLG